MVGSSQLTLEWWPGGANSMGRRNAVSPPLHCSEYAVSFLFQGREWPQAAGGKDAGVVLCQGVNYINFFILNSVSKSPSVVIALYQCLFSKWVTDCCCAVYKVYWINAFRPGDSISVLMINRKINSVLFLHLDFIFTFQVNACLLIAFLVFRALSVLKHSHSLHSQQISSLSAEQIVT